MNEAMIDVDVLILFFNNSELFSKFFEQEKARPGKLFFYQDRARPKRNDKPRIKKCRDIINREIDWDFVIKK